MCQSLACPVESERYKYYADKLGMKFTEVNYLKHPGQGNV